MGCCSLRVEHVKESEQPNMLHLNFLGKDSIEYDNTTEVLPEVMGLARSQPLAMTPTLTPNTTEVIPEVMELALTLTRPLAMTPDPAPNPNPNPKPKQRRPRARRE